MMLNVNFPKEFIMTSVMDEKICDNIINFFNTNEDIQVEGKCGTPTGTAVNKEIKESVDIPLSLDEIENLKDKSLYNYLVDLNPIVNRYLEEYEYCGAFNPFSIKETVNIQYYVPGGGFKQWHTENCGADPIQSKRNLVFMTYLNDVSDKGETEFYYQKLKIKPKKGLTVVWPAYWAFTHRGIPSPSQEKIIVTGWLSY